MPPFRLPELDRTNWPELREQIVGYAPDDPHPQPRSYPGYPRWPLPRPRPRLWPSLARVLRSRRSHRLLTDETPSPKLLAHIVGSSHGTCGEHGRGPVPSSGGLQSLELYLVHFADSWLPAGLYHYDRAAHLLAQIVPAADRNAWVERVPSLPMVEGGALLWVLVGDGARLEDKYGDRSQRFLLLEAGHLMQNLCLVSASLGWATVPLGSFLEQDIARAFVLPPTDLVLYVGAFGKPKA